jgi:nicotinate-nucleotide pyrophosphorylase (carboxylating)
MNLVHDPAVAALISLALAEDLPKGDVTTAATIEPSTRSRGAFVAREGCVVAGLEVAREVFRRLDGEIRFSPAVEEGAKVPPKTTLATVEGPAGTILSGERTALNFLQRLSGVATNARLYADAVAHTQCRVVDTRKTTPGWRRLEKYAARLGGVKNHRADLSSGILIKDNHLVAAGGIAAAVARAKAETSHLFKIEVEVDDHAGLLEAIRVGADIVLLDNMSVEAVREAVGLAEANKLGQRRILLEASGGITLKTIAAYAETGVDLISSGAVTHGARAVDIGLDFEE